VRHAAGLALALLALASSPASSLQLNAQEQRGKRIYQTGESLAGNPIMAQVGAAGISVPANATPCGGCHGADGLGRPEGGVLPSRLVWSELTKAYGGTSPSGQRSFPAYDDLALKRAILAGVDPAGNRLDSAMPRFDIHDDDLSDLVAYIKRLENDTDPGIFDDRLVVGTVVPGGDRMQPVGEAVTAVLEAWFADINESGGIYGRKLELRTLAASTEQQSLGAVGELATGGEVFALVAPFTSGLDVRFADLLEEHRVPLIAPITQNAPVDAEYRAYSFYLLSGLALQGRTLVDYALGRLPDANMLATVVYREDDELTPVAEAMAAQPQSWGRPPLAVSGFERGRLDAPALVASLREAGVQIVYLLGDDAEFAAFAGAADAVGWSPFLFAPGQLCGRAAAQAPQRFQGRLYLAYPSSPGDYSDEGREEFQAFHTRHGLPGENLYAQISAYTSARLLGEALQRVGRALSRDKLVKSLEGLYGWKSGFTPPLSFGANRRIGARGAHIVGVDVGSQRFAASSSWMEPR